MTSTFTFQFTKLMLYVFHLIPHNFLSMYYHLQFASETSEAKVGVQGHSAELGFEPGLSKAHILTTTHHLPHNPQADLTRAPPPWARATTPCLLLGWSASCPTISHCGVSRPAWLENSRRKSALRITLPQALCVLSAQRMQF